MRTAASKGGDAVKGGLTFGGASFFQLNFQNRTIFLLSPFLTLKIDFAGNEHRNVARSLASRPAADAQKVAFLCVRRKLQESKSVRISLLIVFVSQEGALLWPYCEHKRHRRVLVHDGGNSGTIILE